MDNEGSTTNRVLNWIFLIVTFSGSALSWYFDLSGYFPNFGWSLAAIIFLILFAGFSIKRIVNLENDLWQRKPNVIIHHGPYLENVQLSSGKPIIISEKGETVQREISRFAKLAFSNNPKHNTELNHAKRVTAKLTYRDESGTVLVGPIYARWSNSDQPKNLEDIKNKRLLFRQLDSGGVPEPIDLALKIDSEAVCFAYNNDSYLFSLKHPEYRMTANVIYVEILLTGERIKKKYFCKIINGGKNIPLTVTLDQSWMRKLFGRFLR